MRLPLPVSHHLPKQLVLNVILISAVTFFCYLPFPFGGEKFRMRGISFSHGTHEEPRSKEKSENGYSESSCGVA